MLDQITYSLPENLASALRTEAEKWRSEDKISRIWDKDKTVWTGGEEAKWLGWLDIAGRERAKLDEYREFRVKVEKDGFEQVLLMGMGGSSLCPEVLAKTFGVSSFQILDSTVPSQIKAVEESLDIAKTLFIVSSKSGSTLEPNCFKQYFFEKAAEISGREYAGKQFVAVTDPGSKMEQTAKVDNFRKIFYGDPEIGGRFSALSAFGLTAAAAMGIDIEKLLDNADVMSEACQEKKPLDNPAALLGLILGVCWRAGRDKVTIFADGEVYDLGAWLEQLIAESTGKNGVALIPVDREPPQSPVSYGNDRIFIDLRLKGTQRSEEVSAIAESLAPFVSIELTDKYALAQEFFRWEFATAVAGSVMEIDPFDQPDVEAAKIEAKKLTQEYEEKGELPPETPFFESEGFALYTGEEYAKELTEMVDEPTLFEILTAHFANIEPDDYFALLAYIPMNAENEKLLQSIRRRVLEVYLPATCLGFGPRFLHSTGQAYKGGGNNGVFLQITFDDPIDLKIPGQKFTFGVVKDAQARGDFQVLVDRDRRALRVHIGSDLKAGLEKILESLS